jgi:hypothetical protein
MIMEVYGDKVMARRFVEGRQSLEDDCMKGRPAAASNETIAHVREIIQGDRRWKIDKVAEIVDVSHGMCHILHNDLNRHHVLGTCVPLETGCSKSRDSSVGMALSYGLDERGSRVRFPAAAGNFSLHHRVQNGSGAHPASYPVGTRDFFLWGKAAGA